MGIADQELIKRRPWVKFYDIDTPSEIRYPNYPLQDMLRNTADMFPDKVAIWFYGNEITFWELYNTVNRFAQALMAMGIKKGDRVGIMLPNSPQFVIAFQAIVSVGAIVVNMNPMYTVDEMKSIVDTTEPAGIVGFDGIVANLKALTDIINIPYIIVTKISDYIPGAGVSTAADLGLKPGWHHFSELLAKTESCIRPRIAIDPHKDPAVIQFTGGTTGVPKGATLSHYNLVSAITATYYWGRTLIGRIPEAQRTVLCLIPYCHIYGQGNCMGYGILAAATQIILPRFDLDEVMDTIAKFDNIVYFPAVPTMLNAIANHPRAAELEIGKRFTFVGNGAAPCPHDLINRLFDLNVYYQDGYGMSETTAQATSGPPMALKKFGSVGVPYPDVDLKIINPDTGEELPRGEVGEIVMTSPYVMMGYWNNPEETAKQLKDGWVYTGDLAYMDEDGYVFLVDRSKDMIIAGGYNIYPVEIDGVIAGHPKVFDVMCVGIPDEYRGETLKAFIVPKPGETLTEEEINTFCREKLAAYKVPKMIEFRAEVPRTPTGKALRRILREEEIAKQGDKK
jgi:long-chain acyl-CoA synthetase